MGVILIVLLDSKTPYAAVLTLLFLIGLRGLLVKSGVPGWWAFVPCARDYMLAKCAGREPEGRVTSVTRLALSASEVALLVLNEPEGEMSGGGMALSMLTFVLQLVYLVYTVRVYSGLIEVYGARRRWMWLWLFAEFVPALVWGYSPKYQPAWKVEELRREMKSIASSGAAEVLAEGLTVNLRERTAMEFFQKKLLLRDVHLSIPPGRMVLLLGGSGAGKTVLLNAISGYEKADASVMLDGGDMYRQYKKMQYRVGYAPQQDTMRGKDTVYCTLMDAALLRLPMDALPSERRERVETVMNIFGLAPSRNNLVEKLSGGQKKRVSIAMELISNPSLFILDEPDSGLDGVMARELMEQLRTVADQGKIVIVITHTPDRVIDLFDDVIVLAKDGRRVGRLAYYGSIDEARRFFGRDRMEDVVKCINDKGVGGEGRADEYVAKYAEVQYA